MVKMWDYVQCVGVIVRMILTIKRFRNLPS